MYIKALPVAALLGKLYTNGLFSIINIYNGDPSGFFLLNAWQTAKMEYFHQ